MSKVSVHHATYYGIREKHPELPCSILQGIRYVACEALKGVELKICPTSKPFSAIRYNKRVHKINLLKQSVSLSSIKGRVTTAFSIPEYYRQYLEWDFKTSTLRYNRQQDTFYLHVVIHKPSPEPVRNALPVDISIKETEKEALGQYSLKSPSLANEV